MDKEKAKWLLASYRPDGADAEDPMFQEALALALKDRELGEWLAAERAADAAFAAGLSQVQVDECLRDRLSRILLGDAPEDNEELAEMDHLMMGGLEAVAVPSDLRDRILVSAQASSDRPAMTWWRRGRNVLAVAACLTIGVWLAFALRSDLDGNTGRLAAAEVVAEYQAPSELDFRSSKLEDINAFLEGRGAASPHQISSQLRGMESVGCASIEIEGRPASLICFRVAESGQVLHLLVFERGSLQGDLPSLKGAHVTEGGGVASACWRCPACDYLLIGPDVDPAQMRQMLA